MTRSPRIPLIALAVLSVGVAAGVGVVSPASAAAPAVPKYDHIFLMVEENHGYSDVIGDPAAPNLNALASTYGSATDYFSVGDPSEPNYVALLGGSTFGLSSDNPYWLNRVNGPSLISQLDDAGISWKAYLQALPHAGYQGICYPARCNGAPDVDPLYVSKHDAIQNFSSSLNAADWSRQVPDTQLKADLASGQVPRFGYVIPDECHDMHGDPPYCIDSGNPGDPQDQRLVATGDSYLGQTVSEITSAPFWSKGNNAIAITFDEGDNTASCCGEATGGGQVAAIVITSHGPRGVKDATPANHYSLLATIQKSFGLGCLQNTCDTADHPPLAGLLTVTGAPAVATRPIAPPDLATPTPTPAEPLSSSTLTPSAAGWQVVSAPQRGTNDNSFGAVSASSPSDVWAVGNFLPDATGSNQDATLSLAAHYDGTSWTSVPTPNAGPNYNTLFGVAAASGQAWAVGSRLDAAYQDRALIEHWNGSQWQILDNPQPGSQRDLLFAAAAVSSSDVWAVGEQQGADGRFGTLAEHWDGRSWQVVATPDPGSVGDHFYGVAAKGPDDVWAVGQRNAAGQDTALVEHWDGHAWSVVPVAGSGPGSGEAMLDAVAVGPNHAVVAVGEANDPGTGGHPLVLRSQGGAFVPAALPGVNSGWVDLWGVTVSNGTVWAVGNRYDQTDAADQPLLLTSAGGAGWSVVAGPDPNPTDDEIIGGVTTVGTTVWAVGTYSDNVRIPLLQRHAA